MKDKSKSPREKSSRRKRTATPSADNDQQRAASAPTVEEKPAVSQSRRSFLGKVAAATAAAGIIGVPQLAKSGKAATPASPPPTPATQSAATCKTGCDIEIQTPVQRANTSLSRRVQAAIFERTMGIPPHPCNEDETLYSDQNYIGSFTKGLRKINNLGEVDPVAYCALLKATRTGSQYDYNAIPLGCNPCSSTSKPGETTTRDLWTDGTGTEDDFARYYADDSAVPVAEASESESNTLSESDRSQLYDGPELSAEQQLQEENDAAAAQSQALEQEEAARFTNPGTYARGVQRRLVNPQAGKNYDLEGIDMQQLATNAAPAFASADEAAEMAELYWMSLARDVPFYQYDTDPTIAAAVADLNTRYKFYSGLPQFEIAPPGVTPRKNPRGFPTSPMTPLGQLPGYGNNITPGTIFRGFTKGDLRGPYLSQFLIRDIPYGRQTIFNVLQPLAPGTNYMTNQNDWLFVQKGCTPNSPTLAGERRRMISARELVSYVQIDFITQAYWNALLLMIMAPDPKRLDGGGLGIPFDPNNPYIGNCTQEQFVTFGPTHITALLNKVAYIAHKGTWYQKWIVHRRLRPEEFGGRVHFSLKNVKQYPYNPVLNNSTALPKIAAQTGGNYFLPQAYPEGSPIHPAYTAGHATLAGAAATILKAFFNDQKVIPNPVQLDDKGNILPYTGPDAGNLTVGGELDKLASNISLGRDFAGVHWRTDYTASMLLGEDFAIKMLADYGYTYHENFEGFSFIDFRGRKRTGIGRKRP